MNMNLDPDTVLPMLDEAALDRVVDPERCYRVQLGRLGMEELQAVASAQRDADLARVTPLIEAAHEVYRLFARYPEWIPDNEHTTAAINALWDALRGVLAKVAI